MVIAAMSIGCPFFPDAGLNGFKEFLGEFFVIKAMADIFIPRPKAEKSSVSSWFQTNASPWVWL
jgi:hypothetical protein